MAEGLTSSQIIKELNVKYSTFYYLLKNRLIPIKTSKTGRYIWDEESLAIIKEILASTDITDEMQRRKTNI